MKNKNLKENLPKNFLGQSLAVNENIFDCIIVGTGAAAYNAAVHLYNKGIKNFVIITENRLAGTSRNTGSDKQTYYKTAVSGTEGDSPRAMAETLFMGASMDGDIALCEASHSLEEFFHLVSIGVDFPHNAYGEYTGYKTDHDPLQRASSVGPYTSKKMTECLENEVNLRSIKIIDKTRAVKILTNREEDNGEFRSIGLLCLKKNKNYEIYFSKNIIFAAGGPSGLYASTVYPHSQFGSSGITAREGAKFANITEWQYGIGSVKFRWNLSGSYQQVIPRYVAINSEGMEKEFLDEYFTSTKDRDRAVFLKGYQWPFDPGKIITEDKLPGGSSTVDLAIYIEKHIRGNRVYLDFTRNAHNFSITDLDETAAEYLKNSNALSNSPIERLLAMNRPSYELYKTNGIDLAEEYLEIDVLPQHHNGGAEVNIWWETSIRHLFAIGECAGTHGVHRPGGSALNSGQVGGLRAASYIAAYSIKNDDYLKHDDLYRITKSELAEFENICLSYMGNAQEKSLSILQEINSQCAAFIRSSKELEKTRLSPNGKETVITDPLPVQNTAAFTNPAAIFKCMEMQLLSGLLHNGIKFYMESGGKSRGSYLVLDSLNEINNCLKGTETDIKFKDKVLITQYIPEKNKITSCFRQVRPIPAGKDWFEEVWADFREGKIFN